MIGREGRIAVHWGERVAAADRLRRGVTYGRICVGCRHSFSLRYIKVETRVEELIEF